MLLESSLSSNASKIITARVSPAADRTHTTCAVPRPGNPRFALVDCRPPRFIRIKKEFQNCAELTRHFMPDKQESDNSPVWTMKGENMSERDGHRFHHRHNRNGTHDSICLACYLTVASTGEEFELARHENAHACDPVQLYQVSQCSYPIAPDNAELGTRQIRQFTPRPGAA